MRALRRGSEPFFPSPSSSASESTQLCFMPPWPSPGHAFRTASRCLSTASHTTPIEKIVHDSIKVCRFSSDSFSPSLCLTQELFPLAQATGPISVSRYMQLCLGHPTHGYYMNPSNAVFGRKGDFITSPEISQVFGEVCSPPGILKQRKMNNEP